VTGIPENPDKKLNFGGNRAGKRERKRLDKLESFRCRVVSGPVRVTGCVTSDRDSLEGYPGARNQPVTLAHSERTGSLRMLFFDILDP